MSIRKIFKSGSNEEETAHNNTAGTTGTTGIAEKIGDRTSAGHVGDNTLAGNVGDRNLNAGSQHNSILGSGENRGSALTGATHETGTSSSLSEKLGAFGTSHKHGHENTLASKFDPSAESTSHDHKHLNHVTHRAVHHHEVEEVERQREHHRHIHHIQHHVQPVHDVQRPEEIHHQKLHPVTKITEQHANTDEDRALYHGLGEKHRDEEIHHPVQRTIVDKGERVNEIVHHHVHHITQPIVKQEVHDSHRIHTVIPLHHTTHESPIIHKSSLHEPVHMADFLKGGGKLGSGISHSEAGVLQHGECGRTVDGVGEKLAKELGLGSHGNSHAEGTTATSTAVTA